MTKTTATDESTIRAKQAVASAVAKRVRPDMVIGLGTGSTTALAIAELGRRVREEGLSIVGIPTSFSAAKLGHREKIPIRGPSEVARIDLALDGADEVDPQLQLIKGGGAAHTQEKVVARFADQFLVLVDDSKLVPVLGATFAVPVEVLALAEYWVAEAIKGLGGEPQLRYGTGKDGPVVTDHGNLVIDAKFARIDDLHQLGAALDAIPGVIAHGLFIDLADEVYVGQRNDGTVRILQRQHLMRH